MYVCAYYSTYVLHLVYRTCTILLNKVNNRDGRSKIYI